MAQLDEGCVGVNFLDKVQSHKGGLIRLKTELFWYYGRGWDNNPGRICLLLDADAAAMDTGTAGIDVAEAATATGGARVDAALLLIDGSPQWVWVAEQDVELL